MAIIFPPDASAPGVAQGPCAGLEAFQAARPSLPGAWKQACVAVWVLGVVMAAASMAGFGWLRDEPRLRKARSFGVHVLSQCAALLCIAVTTFRYILWDDETNSTRMSCSFTVLGSMIGIGTICVAVTLRAFILYEIFLQTNLVRAMKLDLAEDDDAVEDESLSFSSFAVSLAITVLRLFVPGKDQQSESERAFLLHLRRSRAALSGNGLVRFAFVLLIPVIAAAGAMVGAFDSYRSGCTCDYFFAPVMIGALIESCLCVGFLLVLFLRLWPMPNDAFDVKWEIGIIAFTLAPVVLILYFFQFFDPSELALNYVVPYDLIINAPIIFFIAATSVPVLKALRDRCTRVPSAHWPTQNEFLTLIEDPDFEAMCSRYYCLEALRFIREVKGFKTGFYDYGENWRKVRFNNIVAKFVEPGSPLQINIGAQQRDAILSKRLNFTIDVFDTACDEMTKMLRSNWTDWGLASHAMVSAS